MLVRNHLGAESERLGKTRTAILNAARTLFAKEGFRGATTRAIAQRAGVNVAMVTYFFATKAKLFEAEQRSLGAHVGHATGDLGVVDDATEAPTFRTG